MMNFDRREVVKSYEVGRESATYATLLDALGFPDGIDGDVFFQLLDKSLRIVPWEKFNMIEPRPRALSEALGFTDTRLESPCYILTIGHDTHPQTGERISQWNRITPAISETTFEKIDSLFKIVYGRQTDACVFDHTFKRFLTICHDGIIRYS